MKKALILLMLIVIVLIAIILNYNNILKMIYKTSYSNYVEKYAEEYNVDPLLIYSIIKAESNFDPDAKSSAGALGLMQLMPDTFEWLQTYYKDENDYKFEDLTDPAINIDYGVELLSILSKRYENEETMLCAYNGGLGNVDKWLDNKDYSDDGKTLKVVPFPETDKYRKLVEQNKSIYYQLYFKK